MKLPDHGFAGLAWRAHEATGSVERLLLCFVMASVPAALVGVWNVGHQLLLAADPTTLPALPGAALLRLGGFDSASVSASFVVGASHVVPRLAVAWLVAYGWEALFARVRGRRVDPGWMMCGWMLVLLLPPSASLLQVAAAASFAMLFGSLIFGGTGRYLVSPALLGVLFLGFGYPSLLQGDTAWAVAATEGSAGLTRVGVSWSDAFLGNELSAIGTSSVLACLFAAAVLVTVGAASLRTLLGALVTLAITVSLLNVLGPQHPPWALPWYWHAVLGNLAFGVVFIASDPTTRALTPAGRWLHGSIVGLLTPLIRVLDPSHPEASLFAILLAGLSVPLLDHLVVRVQVARRRRLARVQP